LKPQLRLVDTSTRPLPTVSPEPVRVLLLLRSLSGGGAERVAVNLVKSCDPDLVDLRLGLLRRDGEYLREVFDGRIVAPGDAEAARRSITSAPADIAAMIGRVRPSVVMSFGLGVDLLTWLGLRITPAHRRPKWICRQDNNPINEMDRFPNNAWLRGGVGALARRARADADARVAVASDLAATMGGRAPPRVIHNPTDIDHILAQADKPVEAPDGDFIVAAGRLIRQKGFDLLIRAFAASERARGLKLVILGEGPLRESLLAEAARLGVADRVLLPGFQANPWAWFARARLFVLSSRWEGFGNVVAEAMACGAPTLVTDCDFGPREQVGHGVTGWVTACGDVEALTRDIDHLLANPGLAARLGAAAAIRARDFDCRTIAAEYADFFREVAGAPLSRDIGVWHPLSESKTRAPRAVE
jgi:glycosyltransferase involved in cell wall biosynthesis